jgi:hypothetical protein
MPDKTWERQLDYEANQRQMIAEARQTAAVAQERLREAYLRGRREQSAYEEKFRAGVLERERFKRHLDWLFFGLLGTIVGFLLAAAIFWASH